MAVGTIVIIPEIGFKVVLVAVNEGTFPVPLAANPMAVLLLVHVKVVPFTGPVGTVAGGFALAQKD